MLAKIIAKSTAVKLHFEFCVSSNTNILINTGISFQRRKDNAIKCYLPLQSGEGCVILLMIGKILVCAITYGAAKDGKYSYLFCLYAVCPYDYVHSNRHQNDTIQDKRVAVVYDA